MLAPDMQEDVNQLLFACQTTMNVSDAVPPSLSSDEAGAIRVPGMTETGAVFDGLAALHRLLDQGLFALLPLWRAYMSQLDNDWLDVSSHDLNYHNRQRGILKGVVDSPAEDTERMLFRVLLDIARDYAMEAAER